MVSEEWGSRKTSCVSAELSVFPMFLIRFQKDYFPQSDLSDSLGLCLKTPTLPARGEACISPTVSTATFMCQLLAPGTFEGSVVDDFACLRFAEKGAKGFRRL